MNSSYFVTQALQCSFNIILSRRQQREAMTPQERRIKNASTHRHTRASLRNRTCLRTHRSRNQDRARLRIRPRISRAPSAVRRCGHGHRPDRARVQRHEALDEGGAEFQLAAHARGARDAGLDDGRAAVGGDRSDDFEGRGGQQRRAVKSSGL